MTRDDVMRLEGRELDAAVAELVFGFRVVECDPLDGRYGPYIVREGHWMRVNGETYPLLDLLPEYSTDIAAAWEIAKKLHLFVVPAETGENEWKWVCAPVVKTGWSFVNLFRERYSANIDYEVEHVVSESAPEAICRAALLAALKRSEAKNGGYGV